ncbi:hypothetical protein [Bosea sp. (in: a-proteobacteria)]|uniref:hypothetical protein n=1 Tax=Bosea sp. (in: a-proteobacteria) TaxID=1871050 RepID=UPI0026366B15|nr:hypothetical protein [Bosea sp. (in: a-proteobacteria)]MCO5090958.1 hypothetical protein [Bosea sp. (in: a-proteobacteria)]
MTFMPTSVSMAVPAAPSSDESSSATLIFIKQAQVSGHFALNQMQRREFPAG